MATVSSSQTPSVQVRVQLLSVLELGKLIGQHPLVDPRVSLYYCQGLLLTLMKHHSLTLTLTAVFALTLSIIAAPARSFVPVTTTCECYADDNLNGIAWDDPTGPTATFSAVAPDEGETGHPVDGNCYIDEQTCSNTATPCEWSQATFTVGSVSGSGVAKVRIVGVGTKTWSGSPLVWDWNANGTPRSRACGTSWPIEVELKASDGTVLNRGTRNAYCYNCVQ